MSSNPLQNIFGDVISTSRCNVLSPDGQVLSARPKFLGNAQPQIRAGEA